MKKRWRRRKSSTVCGGELFTDRTISNSWQNLSSGRLSPFERRCKSPLGKTHSNCICGHKPCVCGNSYHTIHRTSEGNWNSCPLNELEDCNLNKKSQSCSNVAELYSPGLRNSHSFENLATKLSEIFQNNLKTPGGLSSGRRSRVDKSPLRSPTKKMPVNFEKTIFLNKIMKNQETKRFGSLSDLSLGEKVGGGVPSRRKMHSQCHITQPSPSSPEKLLPSYFLSPCRKFSEIQPPVALVRELFYIGPKALVIEAKFTVTA